MSAMQKQEYIEYYRNVRKTVSGLFGQLIGQYFL